MKSVLMPSAVTSGSGVCFVDFSGRYSNIFGNRDTGKAAKYTLNESLHRSEFPNLSQLMAYIMCCTEDLKL